MLCVGGFATFWQMDGGKDGMELGGHWAHRSCRLPRPIDSSPSNGTGQMGLDTGQWTPAGTLSIDPHFLGWKELTIENGYW